jgi:multiple sugar transport system ATP-binding protein
MTMADRIVVLKSGTVQQYDTPEAVYERPANQFVAGFIGSPTMNFFPVEQRGEGIAFCHDGAAVAVDAKSEARLRRAGRAVLGIRPEHFAVAQDASDGIGIMVRLVEPLGSDTLIHFDLAGASAIARVDPALRPKVGDRLSLRPQPGKLHLFDTETGQVLQ